MGHLRAKINKKESCWRSSVCTECSEATKAATEAEAAQAEAAQAEEAAAQAGAAAAVGDVH